METIVIADDVILKDLVNEKTRRKAFGQLLAKYQQQIYFFIRHQGLDHEDTDEVTQDVFLTIYRNVSALKLLDELDWIIYGFAAEACKKYFKLKPLEEWLPTMTAHLKQKGFSFKNIAFRLELPLKEVKYAYHTFLSKQTAVQNA
ncbi:MULTISPECIES: RNA polymerase sigma factor [Mucilaginibacter]|jgi:hypothetical protein|uniref:Uncharacterized protein n=2 Tax=Mucilaginibacter TaxID=423349 RepID=A0A6I4I1L3_9SPHI|nr:MULTISPECIES: hypothetical protein [Mucilaginibacter]MBS1527509.1 hypothetical protein [Bacteroidota bacterium]NCD68855.1 hypothetical protein [Mucilaginibacter agri]QQL50560.1 hypothetical protein GO620_003645 [Mucilaginibacter ginkgonis]